MALTLALLALIAVLALAAYGIAEVRRLQAAQQQLQEQLARMDAQLILQQQSIGGLTAGTIGVDRRLARAEARDKILAERQDTFENQQASDQPYAHAIRLVQQGASVTRLIEELDISESEAELIVRLHGGDAPA